MNRTKIPSQLRPVVLTVAGSDSAGMAGLAADCRTQQAMGVHHCSVVTANTAQNNDGLISLNPVSDGVFRDQLSACRQLPISAIKIGMLANAKQVQILADFLADLCSEIAVPVVYDPVLASTSGGALIEALAVDEIKTKLLRFVTLLTPNLPEVEVLTGARPDNVGAVAQAANQLRELGVAQVLITGGHGEGPWSSDYFCSANQHFWLSNPRLDTVNTRGTGCVLASSIAAALALRYSMADAVVIGKMAINQGLGNSYGVGRLTGVGASQVGANQVGVSDVGVSEAGITGPGTTETPQVSEARKVFATAGQVGPVSVHAFPNQQENVPQLSDDAPVHAKTAYTNLVCAKIIDVKTESFPDCGPSPLGLYPVVDRAHWLERLLPQGVSTIQLRVKDLQDAELESEIKRAIAIADRAKARLFINDYWQLAIKYGAYGVHLGQEDLATADIGAIKKAGLRLGLSTHCHYEVARAHRFKPSYMACGPVFATTSKDMPWVPHGLEGLSYWQRALDYPLVAIGGIGEDEIADIAKTGVDGIAMISAITQHPNPEHITRHLQKRIAQNSPLAP